MKASAAKPSNTKPAIIISGGAGFLGSHLCDAYIKRGWRVIAIDNLSTGAEQNIQHLFGHADFIYINHDICEPLPPLVTEQKGVAVVANLASPASPPHYQRLALETLRVGSDGVLHMLDLACQHEARFFQASTSEVYGDPEVHPQPESYKGSVNCYGPRSMYDESKRYAEALVYSYRHRFHVSTTVARFFNTYGPRMDAHDGRVVSNFIVQALEGKPLTVYGKGNQTRSFCYVDDLVAGIVALIDAEEEGPVNLGNPGEFTILELANLVRKLTGSTSKIVYKPLPGDDPMQRQPVINFAKQKLGWKPKVKLREGLLKTIAYFDEQLNTPDKPVIVGGEHKESV